MEHLIGVIGLGYVGLPLAVEFGKKYPTTGFDLSETRISELKASFDRTREVTGEELRSAKFLSFTSRDDELRSCNTYIVAVPTPVDI